MRDPRLLDWHFGEPTPILPAPAGSRPSRRPLPQPVDTLLPGRVRLTTYVVPWWEREWLAHAAVWSIVVAIAYLLAHVIAWVVRP